MQGIEQISTTIQQMERTTQSTAATAEEGAASSEELYAQARETLKMLDRLLALTGGADTRTPPAAPLHAHAHAAAAAGPAAQVLPRTGTHG
jgi:methyl-accepting chemotaxis protein